jgi:hypothetical protein
MNCEKCGLEKKDDKCKNCLKIYMSEYYKNNHAKLLKNNKDYYQNNKSKRLQYRKEYYLNNSHQISQYKKEYNANNIEAIAKYKRQWYDDNKIEILQDRKIYYENNKDIILPKLKDYQANHKIECNKHQKNRYNNDPIYKLRHRCSAMIRVALKSNKNNISILKFLPYTIQELKEHLEKQFDNNMSWNNHGNYWHIDHIVPQSKLPYSSMSDDNFKKCWALDNLQPLEAIANIKKSNKIIGEL